jgi:glycosyltransferase involved in cell wall biosynthesis
MAVYGAWASWRLGIPHLITMHGGRYYAHRLRRRLALRAAVAASAHTVAVSAPLARHLATDLRLSIAKIRTVPNGVPYQPPARVSLRDELGLTNTDRLLVAVGNLYPVKGHRHLIDAVSLLVDRYPNLHVAISGRGDLEKELRTQARDRGLKSSVHLLGLRADVGAILAAADVFVLPSLSEGLPLALLEAMFAGCPIVASDVGEVRTALNDGRAGLLVPPGNPEALAAALDRLLRDPQEARRFGDRAGAHARAEYDLARMVDRYVDLYKAALARC